MFSSLTCNTHKNNINCLYWAIIHIIFLVIWPTTFTTVHTLMQDNFNVPCRYKDSINITNGQRNADGSITYDGIRFTKADYGTYDYKFENGLTRVNTKPHIRGCTCKYRPCISLCCPRNSIYSDQSGCGKINKFNLTIDVWSETNETKRVDMFPYFGYVLNMPCEETVEKDPESHPTDIWYLYDVRMI